MGLTFIYCSITVFVFLLLEETVFSKDPAFPLPFFMPLLGFLYPPPIPFSPLLIFLLSNSSTKHILSKLCVWQILCFLVQKHLYFVIFHYNNLAGDGNI